MTMRGPKSSDPSQVPRCSEGRGAVVLDGLMTVVHGLVGVVLLSAEEGGAGAAFLLAGSVHLGSAVAGNSSAKRCTKAHEAHAAWRRTALPAQQSAEGEDEGPPDTTNPTPAQPPTQPPAQSAAQPATPAQPQAQPATPAQPQATQSPAPPPAPDQETQANPWADFWVTQ